MIRERSTRFEFAYAHLHIAIVDPPPRRRGLADGPHHPDCGCGSPDRCMHCTWCGSCIRNQEFCPCLSAQADDETGFDLFRDTGGG